MGQKYVMTVSNRSPYWWGTAALAAAVTYPFTPLLVFWTAHMARSYFQLFLFSGASLVMLLYPACGLFLLLRTAKRADRSSLIRRGLGILLIISPVLRVFSSVVAGLLNIPASSLAVWFDLWIILAALMLWRIANPKRIFSVRTMSKTRTVHGLGAILIALFVVAHMTVNLSILKSPEAYLSAASALRLAYRTPIAEPILIAVLVLQIATGLMMAADTLVHRVSSENLIQIACGLYLVVFIASHTIAVAVLGRVQLNPGPDFTYASTGPRGLLANLGGVPLAPYYLLAVVTFFTHLSRPVRVWTVRIGKTRLALPGAYAVVSIGFVVAVALLIALCTPMITRHLAHRFPNSAQLMRSLPPPIHLGENGTAGVKQLYPWCEATSRCWYYPR